MKVMLADIQEKALDEALHELKGGRTGPEVRGVHCDVADLASLKRAADETFAAFGNVHVICNNAGVGWGGQVESIPAADWEWQIGVNLLGVIYGVQVFLPHINPFDASLHVHASGLLALSLLQARLIDLQLPIKLEEWKYR